MKKSNESYSDEISFIDANIFIYALAPLDAEKRSACQAFLDRIEQGKLSAVTDYLVLLEAYSHVERLIPKEAAKNAFRRYLSLANLNLIPLGNTLFFEALKTYGLTNLTLSDHAHYTAAKMICAHFIYSYDKDFDGLDIPRVEP